MDDAFEKATRQRKARDIALETDPKAGNFFHRCMVTAALKAMDYAEAEANKACAKIADDWLAAFGERGPTSGAVSAQTWANDAVKDIADEIRKRASPAPEKQPEQK